MRWRRSEPALYRNSLARVALEPLVSGLMELGVQESC